VHDLAEVRAMVRRGATELPFGQHGLDLGRITEDAPEPARGWIGRLEAIHCADERGGFGAREYRTAFGPRDATEIDDHSGDAVVQVGHLLAKCRDPRLVGCG